MLNELMPINPITGLTALGFTRRGPIWPVMGGAPNDGAGNGGGSGNNDAGNGSGAGGNNTGTGNGGGGNHGGGSNSGNTGGADEPKSYTQSQLDAMFADRVERDRKARGVENFDTYKASHEELQQLKTKDLPEADRLRQEIAAKETEAATATAAAEKATRLALQYEVAAAKNVPLTSATRLQGATKEELEADADKFLADIGGASAGSGARQPRPNQQQGNSSGGAEKSVSAGAALFAAQHGKKPDNQ